MNKSTQNAMFSSKKQDWTTPQAFYERLNRMFGPFDLDPCSSEENAKCENFFTESDDGLEQDWDGHNVFANPPYGREVAKWIKKGYEESRKDDTTVVLLVAARPDTKAWHKYIMKADEIYFVKGRLKFGEGKNSAPFPSAVVVFRNDRRQQTIGTLERT